MEFSLDKIEKKHQNKTFIDCLSPFFFPTRFSNDPQESEEFERRNQKLPNYGVYDKAGRKVRICVYFRTFPFQAPSNEAHEVK